MAAKIRAGKATAPRRSRLLSRSRALLDEDRPDESEPHQPPPIGRCAVVPRRRPRRRGRDRPPRASAASSTTPVIRAPASTSACDQRPALSLRRVAQLDDQRAVRGWAAATNGRSARRPRNESGPARAVQVDPHRGAAPVAPQAGRRVHLQQRAAHDPDAVAQPLGLVEVVGADHDRAAQLAQRGDEVAHRLGRRWIEAAGRLVEVDHLRLVQQRAGDGDLLAHPLAEAADPAVGVLGHARPRRGIGRPPSPAARRGRP